MVWEKNLILYHDTGSSGKCPKCKSEKVNIIKHSHGLRNSITFECKMCGSAEHFDGILRKDNI